LLSASNICSSTSELPQEKKGRAYSSDASRVQKLREAGRWVKCKKTRGGGVAGKVGKKLWLVSWFSERAQQFSDLTKSTKIERTGTSEWVAEILSAIKKNPPGPCRS